MMPRSATTMTRLILALLLLAGCKATDLPACLERCEKFGGDTMMCQKVCTTPCAELQATYGMSLDTCAELQTGGGQPAPPPAAPQ